MLIATIMLTPAWLIVDHPVQPAKLPITWIALMWLGCWG